MQPEFKREFKRCLINVSYWALPKRLLISINLFLKFLKFSIGILIVLRLDKYFLMDSGGFRIDFKLNFQVPFRLRVGRNYFVLFGSGYCSMIFFLNSGIHFKRSFLILIETHVDGNCFISFGSGCIPIEFPVSVCDSIIELRFDNMFSYLG